MNAFPSPTKPLYISRSITILLCFFSQMSFAIRKKRIILYLDLGLTNQVFYIKYTVVHLVQNEFLALRKPFRRKMSKCRKTAHHKYRFEVSQKNQNRSINISKFGNKQIQVQAKTLHSLVAQLTWKVKLSFGAVVIWNHTRAGKHIGCGRSLHKLANDENHSKNGDCPVNMHYFYNCTVYSSDLANFVSCLCACVFFRWCSYGCFGCQIMSIVYVRCNVCLSSYIYVSRMYNNKWRIGGGRSDWATAGDPTIIGTTIPITDSYIYTMKLTNYLFSFYLIKQESS